MTPMQEIKNKFRSKLPYGFVTKIQETLEKDYKRKLSRGKISQVCNPEKTDWDSDVISIAIDLASSSKSKENDIINKAESL